MKVNGTWLKAQLKMFEGVKGSLLANYLLFNGKQAIRWNGDSFVAMPFEFEACEVEFKAFKDAIPKGECELTIENGRLWVKGERNVSVEVFHDGCPELPDVNAEQYPINLKDLQDKYKFFKPIISKKSEGNIAFSCVHFTAEKMASTNGQQLMVADSPIPGNALISYESLDAIAKLPPSGNISWQDEWIKIEGDGYVSYHRNMDGNFPDYQRVIPDGNLDFVNIPRQQLIDAIKPLKNVTRITVQREDVLIEETDPADRSKVISSSSLKTDKPKSNMKLMVDPKQLLDGLKPLKYDYVTIQQKSELHPFIIEEDDYLYLQVTLREAQ